jgi:16S rRNA (guanine527-N7)-methyltransferase
VSVSGTKNSVGEQLNLLLEAAGLPLLEPKQYKNFGEYCSLLIRWNQRVNLTAIHDEDGILRRHFVESIACARAIPFGITTLLDFGSGAGFPGIPIALCRPEIVVTLADSQGKKTAFLNEAVRVLGLTAKVHSGRAETLVTSFDCVALRAVDRMGLAVQAAAQLVCPGGWLALMTTGKEIEALKAAAGAEFAWAESPPQLGGKDQVLAFGRRAISSPA